MDGRLGRFMKAALWSTSSNRFAMRFSALLNRNSDYRNLLVVYLRLGGSDKTALLLAAEQLHQ
jgi:hypothetical protein